MSKKIFLFFIIAIFAVLISFNLCFGQIPDHPSKLTYKSLEFNPPKPADYRVALPNGMAVYIQEDHSLPTFDMTALIRTGSIYDPKEKIGLA
ncbi:insulinase family protein, partial [candidate division KSB1 bacterium]|nr:insulinase family protein [candidate division KSB1 bacterium]